MSCSISDCSNNPYARGWCNKHYTRWLRHGDPLAGGKRFNTPEEAFAARTEWQGDCLIWTGSKGGYVYGEISVGGKKQYAHRYAWERENGPIPEGMLVDHKDHCDPLCVNVEHLRIATHSQNGQNRSGVRKSPSRNVQPKGDRWEVAISREGKRYYFGLYDDLDEAILVEKLERHKLFKEFAGR